MRIPFFLFLNFALLLVVFACNRTGIDNPTEDIEALYQRFNGSYKAVQSTSSEPVDINRDGIPSTNLLLELTELGNTPLILHLKPAFTFTLFWPEQYFSTQAEPTTYDPSMAIHYAKQGLSRGFRFNPSLTEVLLLPDTGTSDPRWVRPSAVKILSGDLLEVKLTKRLFTTAGWKSVVVTTLYERQH